MATFHKTLTLERWQIFSLMEQLGHVGSEIDRAVHWAARGDRIAMFGAVDRALELLDFTVEDPRWRGPRLREILRTREVICDRFYGDNEYHTDDASLKKYFLQFAMAARKNR